VPDRSSSGAPKKSFPRGKRAQRPAVAEMLFEKLAEKPLVRPARGVVIEDGVRARKPAAQRFAGVRRKFSAARSETRAPRAQRSTSAMIERHVFVRRDFGVAARALIERRRESEFGDNAPCAGERDRRDIVRCRNTD